MQKPLYHYLYIRSPILKIALGIISTLIMLGVILFVLVTEPARMAAQEGNWTAREIEKGAMIYYNNCSSCHAYDGKAAGYSAPALHSRYFFTQRMQDVEWTGNWSDYVKLTVAAGRPNLPQGTSNDYWTMGKMPTWHVDLGGPLRGDQVDAVTAYVMNWEESALKQTPAEDTWSFFRNILAKDLPYEPNEEGYQAKFDAAVDAARLSGVTSYELEGEVFEFEQGAASNGPQEGVVREPQDLYLAMACLGCHNANEDQTDSNRGPLGPHQGNLHETAPTRVDGLSAEEYVYQSIVEPGAYVVDGYTDGQMPMDFADKMTEEEIQGLVAWLLDPNREE